MCTVWVVIGCWSATHTAKQSTKHKDWDLSSQHQSVVTDCLLIIVDQRVVKHMSHVTIFKETWTDPRT